MKIKMKIKINNVTITDNSIDVGVTYNENSEVIKFNAKEGFEKYINLIGTQMLTKAIVNNIIRNCINNEDYYSDIKLSDYVSEDDFQKIYNILKDIHPDNNVYTENLDYQNLNFDLKELIFNVKQ